MRRALSLLACVATIPALFSGCSGGDASSGVGGSSSGGPSAGTTSAGAATGGSGGSNTSAGSGTGGGAGSNSNGGTGGSSAGSAGASGSGGGMSGNGGAAGAAGAGGAGGGTTALMWPNETSHTNSDTWLVEHHDEITELRPRVLLINFVAGRDEEEVRDAAAANANALAEGSKYHGYSKPNAPAFLKYEVVHFVDLGGQPTRSGNGFGFTEFMTSQTFADKVKFKEPNGSKNLTVCELFEKGLINEAWVAEPSDDSAKLYEMLGRGQVYNADFSKKAGQFDNCSGNGCLSGFTCGVSVRLGEINLDRGPGCATHAYGHGIEGQVKRNQIPYFSQQSKRFFNFGMKQSFGTPFDDFYMCPYDTTQCIQYLSPSHLKNGSASNGNVFDIEDFGTGCGNVHFAPHSRGQYDYENSSAGVTGRATCEGYGVAAGAGGKDTTTDISYDTYKALNQNRAYSDCGGGWQIYMRQSFPGYQNQAKGTDGKPMKNWWPFLFY